jgi:hypothetical protein
MRLIPHPQGTPEWLQARCGIPTASCFGDVMAKIKTGEAASRRNYRAKLVVEQLTGKPVKTFTTKSMEQGTEREPFARAAYEAETGAIVEEVGLCLHDTLDCGASPDGRIGRRGGLEIKCPELATHLDYLTLAAEPPEYTWQIQGQMWIADMDWVDFVSFNPDFPEHLQLVIRRIKRNDEAIKKLAAEVAAFIEEVKAETERVRNMKVAA